MSAASETVRSFFERLNAASLGETHGGGFLADVETLLKERDAVLDALETAVRIIEEAPPGSFDNGNSEAGTDEGDWLTGRWLEETRTLIKNARAA